MVIYKNLIYAAGLLEVQKILKAIYFEKIRLISLIYNNFKIAFVTNFGYSILS